jgi:hypothetical protein
MTPEQLQRRGLLAARIRALITSSAGGKADDATRDALLLDLALHQAEVCEPYGRFYAQRARGRSVSSIADVPALPTDAFRFARIASRPASEDVRLFESSGTTSTERSQHAYADLTLYDLAAQTAARHALFPDRERIKLLILAPSEAELPSSSLSYMLARFVEWFGDADSQIVWPVQGDKLTELAHSLRAAEQSGEPVALLGTSFAFVHALDGLGQARFRLPAHSRIMQTGGFKGKAREIAPADMRAWLSESFGVPEPFIVAEYGMTELSSQLYETPLREALLGLPVGERTLWAPPWVRALPVHGERLVPVSEGEEGLVRLDDAANLDSVVSIQTADVARREGRGFTLLGRARGAVARGCSITADELLGRRA